MEFYLNQKSLPMIRKCGNCRFFHKDFASCSLIKVTNAYDHKKNIYLTVGENLFCDNHKFKNEDTLKEEAILVEYDNIDEAMEVINKSKAVKDVKKYIFGNEIY
jgi:carbonic anhydrase